MRRMRVLVLMHKDLVPPESAQRTEIWRPPPGKPNMTSVSTLRKLGHDVQALGVKSDLEVIRAAVEDWKPHIAFNLLEEFDGGGGLRPECGVVSGIDADSIHRL
jgi:D-alanine-D-alanine ligase